LSCRPLVPGSMVCGLVFEGSVQIIDRLLPKFS
jgi:hypothetical protein